MNMPGFTAEAVLYVTDGRYQLVIDKTASGAADRVLPQLLGWIECEGNVCCSVEELSVYGPGYEFHLPFLSCGLAEG